MWRFDGSNICSDSVLFGQQFPPIRCRSFFSFIAATHSVIRRLTLHHCHMSAQGGDARNPFGQAFESGGEQITPMLRAQFPDRFVYPISRGSALTGYFSDPDKKQVVVEAAGMKTLIDVDKVAVNGAPVTPAGTTAAPAVVPSQETGSRSSRPLCA
jgi:hypothetical protein